MQRRVSSGTSASARNAWSTVTLSQLFGTRSDAFHSECKLVCVGSACAAGAFVVFMVSEVATHVLEDSTHAVFVGSAVMVYELPAFLASPGFSSNVTKQSAPSSSTQRIVGGRSI